MKKAQTAIDLELREEILKDRFEKKTPLSQFFFSHVPPFRTWQREADIDHCNKSYLAAMLFNQRELSPEVPPISFDKDEIPSCRRLKKK